MICVRGWKTDAEQEGALDAIIPKLFTIPLSSEGEEEESSERIVMA